MYEVPTPAPELVQWLAMAARVHRYTRNEFLGEFFPDTEDKAAIAAGMEQLRARQLAWRLAEMRCCPGTTQAEVAARKGRYPGPHLRQRARQARREQNGVTGRLHRSPRRPTGDHRRLR